VNALQLSPAAQKLLQELARRDTGNGVVVRYASRGRWYLDGVSSSAPFNTRTFTPLYDAGLAVGWDEYDDDGPLRITEAGRQLAAELEAQHKAQQAAKRDRAKPNPDSATAMRLLREIAKQTEPVAVWAGDRDRRIWRLGGRDGYSASVNTWLALSSAGRIHVEYGFAGGKRVSITEAGRQRLAKR
jgi:hypothetical protein